MSSKGKTDVAMMGVNVFNHLSKDVIGKGHMGNVDVHSIFLANEYHLVFFDKKLKRVQ